MKKHISRWWLKTNMLAAFCFLFAFITNAQLLPKIPKPKVYYSFNRGSFSSSLEGYLDLYKSGNYAKRSSKTPSPTKDRFGRAVDALFLTPEGSTTENEAFDIISGDLFGLISSGDWLPPNFTFSCWINVPSVNDNTTRKIWSGGDFALYYKGQEIFLRRTITWGLTINNYEYKFWAPASFDVPGWYQIFLVYGTRPTDKMQYIKLFVGKPGYIAYGNDGPKEVPANSSPLAWNFGGGYSVHEPSMPSKSQWSFGNVENGFHSPYIMDDFAAWDVALTENEAKQLCDCQRNFSGRDNRCWDSNPVPESSALANLALSKGSLTPAFASDIKVYETQVEKETDQIGVIPDFGNGAKIKVNGSPTINGSLSTAIPLRMGTNMISVEATPEGIDTAATYTINVNRGISADATLATNMITPNGDGKNDVWIVKDIELFPDNTVTVFDKGGRRVFSKHGYNNDWNGTSEGAPLAEGNYYYLIDYGADQPRKRGFITILKTR